MMVYALSKGDAYLRFLAEDVIKMACGKDVQLEEAQLEDAILFGEFIRGETKRLKLPGRAE
jgi:hypothetical protein